jgi:phosphoribosylanthranilate isomerase
MARTRIKFCGMTRAQDARAAAECGADAIGMVLHSQTPRRISTETARQILDVLPPYVTAVGMFVDAPAQLIEETAGELRLSHVQLHGDEPPEMVEGLSGLKVIKAVRVRRGGLAEALEPWRGVRGLSAILLETGGTEQAGGSGVENDWDAIAEAKKSGVFEALPPIIAAGGLRPQNVAQVIRLIAPYAVDVSSGIEASRGIKSIEKMQLFASNVRSCDR